MRPRSPTILTRIENQTIEEWISDSKALSPSWSIDVQILEEPCSQLRASSVPCSRDDLFTNKSHSRPVKPATVRNRTWNPSGPMQIYPPLYPTHFPEWQRYTIHTDPFFPGQVWKFNIFRRAVERGSHDDVTRTYGKTRTATRVEFRREREILLYSRFPGLWVPVE